MRVRFYLIASFAFIIALLVAHGHAQYAELESHFTRVQLTTIDAEDRRLNLSIDGRTVVIALVKNDIRSPAFRAQVTSETGTRAVDKIDSNTYTGSVDGEPSSVARMYRRGSQLLGVFETRGRRYFIEPASVFSTNAGPRDHVVYQREDLIDHDPLSCGSHLIDKLERAGDYVAENAAPSAMRRLEIATDADFEYVNIFGSVAAANAEILGILNVIDGLYESELRLSLSVVYQHAWTTPDPFAGPNSHQIVRNFQAHWNANFPASAIPRDTAHLFSGKGNIQGQGWAFIGVICNNSNSSYGGSGYVNFASGQHLITSHELAHNLGASHVDAPQGCANTLMNAGLTGATPLTFCQYSRNEIADEVAANGGCLASATSGAFDFDGDSKTDLSIFRPAPGEWWWLKSSTGGNAALQFGQSSDRIVPSDYTGDGKTDVAFWRPSTGFWFVLRSEDFSFYSFPFGTAGDVPVPADYDGDGKADAAVFRASDMTWYISRSLGGTDIIGFGSAGDLPVAADYDGDGKADIAIYRPNAAGGAQWWVRRSSNASVFALQFGTPTDKTGQGDYTGDGKADIAFWRPSTGFWNVLRSEDFSYYAFPFGANGDTPVPGDYDGDGKFDAGVFRQPGAQWFVNRSTGGTLIQSFGIAGDVSVPNAYVR